MPNTSAGTTFTPNALAAAYPSLSQRFARKARFDEHLLALYRENDPKERSEYLRLLRRLVRTEDEVREIENTIYCKIFLREKKSPLRVIDSLGRFFAYLSRMVRNWRISQWRRTPDFLELLDHEILAENRECETRDLFASLPDWIDRRYSKTPDLAEHARALFADRAEDPRVTQSDLARRLGVNQATVSRMIQQLRNDIPDYLADPPTR